jgi:hypothetical protein
VTLESRRGRRLDSKLGGIAESSGIKTAARFWSRKMFQVRPMLFAVRRIATFWLVTKRRAVAKQIATLRMRWLECMAMLLSTYVTRVFGLN